MIAADRDDEEVWTFVSVLELTRATTEDEALLTLVFVLLLMFVSLFVIAAAIDVEALKTFESVFALTALVIPEVCAFVFALMLAAREVEAVNTAAAVLLLT